MNISIMIIGSGFDKYQEYNSLVKRLIEEGHVVKVYSYDVVNRNNRDQKFSSIEQPTIDISSESKPEINTIKAPASERAKEVRFKYSNNYELIRVLHFNEYANTDFYIKEFNKNKGDKTIIIDSLGFPFGFKTATTAIKDIKRTGGDCIHLDWCTCCSPAKHVKDPLSRRNSSDFPSALCQINENKEKVAYDEKFLYKTYGNPDVTNLTQDNLNMHNEVTYSATGNPRDVDPNVINSVLQEIKKAQFKLNNTSQTCVAQ